MPLLVQLAHTAVVAPTYHVGSFDDDGNYLMAAHVLANGGWLNSIMPSGATVASNYLPGYPALLVPIIWLFGNALWLPRVFSTLCAAALYPLLWAWMGRREIRPVVRVTVLAALALNPVLATFSTMVMAEGPFLVIFVLALTAVDVWDHQPAAPPSLRMLTAPSVVWGAIVTVLMAYLIWVKEAGVGLAVGLGVYLLWRRRWARAAAVGLGAMALMLPAVVARLSAGGSALGDRYASEILPSGRAGLVHQLISELWPNIWFYLHNALRQSITPIGNPLPTKGPVYEALYLFGFSVPLFVIVGAVAWYRRHPRADTWMVTAYFLETLAYPYINQRRVILVLPVVLLWYVVGAYCVGRFVWARAHRVLAGIAVATAVPIGTAVAVLGAGVPTAAAFTKNFMYRVGQQSSEFSGSAAMDLLARTGTPAEVVETDYRGTVAFFTGHRTAWTAFTTTTSSGPLAPKGNGRCNTTWVGHELSADRADFLFVGDINAPGLMDSPCLLSLATTKPDALTLGLVRLLSTNHDDESVFERLGPGTDQPSLEDPTAWARPAGAASVTLAANGRGDAGGKAYLLAAHAGKAVFTWRWSGRELVSQVSVGTVVSTAPVTQAQVQLGRSTSKGEVWRTVAASSGTVGDTGTAPYLLAQPVPAQPADALRVVVTTSGTAEVALASAIGTRAVAARAHTTGGTTSAAGRLPWLT